MSLENVLKNLFYYSLLESIVDYKLYKSKEMKIDERKITENPLRNDKYIQGYINYLFRNINLPKEFKDINTEIRRLILNYVVEDILKKDDLNKLRNDLKSYIQTILGSMSAIWSGKEDEDVYKNIQSILTGILSDKIKIKDYLKNARDPNTHYIIYNSIVKTILKLFNYVSDKYKLKENQTNIQASIPTPSPGGNSQQNEQKENSVSNLDLSEYGIEL